MLSKWLQKALGGEKTGPEKKGKDQVFKLEREV